MYAGFYEEGDKCGASKECNGKLHWPKVENCACHINPPCGACENNSLACNVCGWNPEEPKYRDVQVVPELFSREYKPRQLDNTKIDFVKKSHTHFTMIVEGVYPEGTTPAQVREKVNGTFGGRFEHFGEGRFKFIAYTD